MTFRPTLWATVAVAGALAVLLGLGTWQLERRAWKEQLLETRAERLSAPALSYADIAAAAGNEIETLEFRPVRLRGRYLDDSVLKLLSRTRGGQAGFHLIAALAIEGESAVVLVDRGWAPVGGDAAAAPLPAGVLEIDGFVRRFETPGRFTPDNDPDAGAWFYLDGDQMAAALGVAAVAPVYVQQAPGAGPPGAYPVGGVPDVALRNTHLQYALTWYALAVALLVIYVIFHLRRRAGED